MLSINTDNITFIDNERGPSPNADPTFSISDIDEEGLRTVSFSFKIAADDRWSLSVSKGMGDDKVAFGFGQGSTHQELPENVVIQTQKWVSEENKKKEMKSRNVISFPPSFWED